MRQTVLAALFFCLAGTMAFARAPSEELLRRFREEAPQGWAKLEELQTRLEFKARVAENSNHTGRTPTSESYGLVCRRRAGGVMVEVLGSGEESEKSTAVTGLNERYLFNIRKAKEGQEGWRLDRFQDALNETERDMYFVHYRSFIHPLTTCTPVLRPRLLDIVAEPGFTAESATAAGPFVEVRFRYAHTTIKKDRINFTGTLVLDPEKHWAVREWTCNNGKNDYSRQIEFADEDVRGYPVIKQIKDVNRYKTGNLETVYEFDHISEVSLPSSAFRLTAFGLPEPAGYETTDWTPILWTALVVCAVLMLGFWWYSRRKSQASGPG